MGVLEDEMGRVRRADRDYRTPSAPVGLHGGPYVLHYFSADRDTGSTFFSQTLEHGQRNYQSDAPPRRSGAR